MIIHPLPLLDALIGFTLTVVLLISVLTKNVSGDLVLSERLIKKYGWSVSVIETCTVAFTLLSIYLLSAGATRSSAALMLAVMLIGEVLRRSGVVTHCNCFGSLGQGPLRGFVTGFTYIAAIYLLVFGSQLSAMRDEKFIVVAFACATALSMWLPNIYKNGKADNLSEGSRVVESTLIIGSLEGEEVAYYQVSQDCPFVIFVGLSQHCITCRELKPALLKLAKTIEDHVRIVFLVHGRIVESEYLEDSIVLTVNEDFVKEMTTGAYPFAFMVDARTGTKVGGTAYGTHIANLILKAAAVSMSAIDSDQAER